VHFDPTANASAPVRTTITPSSETYDRERAPSCDNARDPPSRDQSWRSSLVLPLSSLLDRQQTHASALGPYRRGTEVVGYDLHSLQTARIVVYRTLEVRAAFGRLLFRPASETSVMETSDPLLEHHLEQVMTRLLSAVLACLLLVTDRGELS